MIPQFPMTSESNENNNKPSWHLDLFSTFLSRKHSYHLVIGKKRYVKVKKEKKSE